MTPVARVAYHNGLTVPVTVQEPPEDVTGAAGELDGGCDGGVNVGAGCELAPLGWLDAGVLAGLVAGALAGVVGAVVEVVVLAWPGTACAKAAASPAVAAAAVAVIASERDLMRLNTRRRWITARYGAEVPGRAGFSCSAM
jgi:hypothetical protein